MYRNSLEKSIFKLSILLMSLLLSACGGQHISRKSLNTTEGKLYAQYQVWKGTPYRLGGLSKKGIDCSGFVYLTFRNKFSERLPRTTEAQAKQGKRIYIGQLQAGDLIFFKTGLKTRHVGIYLSEGRFLHASTSKGVIISRLDNVYWRKTYWLSRRILK